MENDSTSNPNQSTNSPPSQPETPPSQTSQPDFSPEEYRQLELPTLQDLMTRDPLSLTKPDLQAVVHILRTERAIFLQRELEGKRPGRTATPKPGKIPATKKTKATKEELDNLLKDLDL